MERIQALIAQLKELADRQADPAQMMLLVQLIQQELSAHQHTPRTLGTSKVAVLMPGSRSTQHIEQQVWEKYAPRPVAVAEAAADITAVAPPVPKPQVVQQPVAPQPVVQEPVVQKPVVQEPAPVAVPAVHTPDLNYDPLVEIPTLSQQVKPAEPESINDRLKQSKIELAEVLKESPIKDLRKAIGINDRFLFINELFRGDEAMYERSIKTINGFNIYPEAEYWISRELKTKLGWNTDLPSVLQFDQLVKRRFS